MCRCRCNYCRVLSCSNFYFKKKCMSIDFMKFITLEHSFPISANWFDGFYDVNHTLHRNTYLSTLRLCGVFCTIANIRTLKRTVCTIQRFAVSQKNCTKAITISPFSLSLLFSAKNRWFSTLRCKNRRHPTEVECRLFCCPILLGRCRFCSFLKLLSYRHTANRPFCI